MTEPRWCGFALRVKSKRGWVNGVIWGKGFFDCAECLCCPVRDSCKELTVIHSHNFATSLPPKVSGIHLASVGRASSCLGIATWKVLLFS